MDIHYDLERRISAEEFVDVLRRSALAERRPVEDAETMAAMVTHGNLLCTAWDGEKLVGVARSVTDFAWCCYLSDLAVDVAYQKRGIGQELIRRTQSRLGEAAKLILLSAPKATEYYPKLGFAGHPSAWVIGARQELT